MNLSLISFYMSNGHIELSITYMESPHPIKHKHAISAYFRKQDQFAQSSYSIMKILSIIRSFSLPINMTSRSEEQR